MRFAACALELLFDQLFVAGSLAPELPELRLQCAHRYPTVLALVRAVTDQPAGQLAFTAARRLATGERHRRRHHHPSQ